MSTRPPRAGHSPAMRARRADPADARRPPRRRSRWPAAARRLPVGVLLGVLVAAPAVFAAPASAAAQDSSEEQPADAADVEVRIEAQRLEDGRVEFGMRLRIPGEAWSERVLPERRFLAPGVEPGRWYVSSSMLLQRQDATGQPAGGAGVGTDLRIAAQPLTDGRQEFALQQRRPGGTWSERMLPARRFVPPDAAVGRWLASSPLAVGIDAGSAEPDPADTPGGDAPQPPAGDAPSGGDDNQPGSVQVSDDVLDFDMTDVHTGETVNIRSVVNGETPLLFWLWSPY